MAEKIAIPPRQKTKNKAKRVYSMAAPEIPVTALIHVGTYWWWLRSAEIK
jgi:hypothetical protein